MLEYEQLVKLKNNLVVGRRYGNLVFTEHHAKLNGKLLNVYKVSSSGTYYCAEGNVKFPLTFSIEMLEVPRFNVGDVVSVIDPKKVTVPAMSTKMLENVGQIMTVNQILLKNNLFAYQLQDSIYIYPEEALAKLEFKPLDGRYVEDILKNYISNENRLQEKDSHILRGERVKGSGVHGRLCKASVQSRRLRDPKAIKGS